jgi:hypothetical protein
VSTLIEVSFWKMSKNHSDHLIMKEGIVKGRRKRRFANFSFNFLHSFHSLPSPRYSFTICIPKTYAGQPSFSIASRDMRRNTRRIL